jgi:hypothetical protein
MLENSVVNDVPEVTMDRKSMLSRLGLLGSGLLVSGCASTAGALVPPPPLELIGVDCS